MKREALVHRRSLIEWGRLQPETVLLSGDLTVACEADGFRDAYPDRFMSTGLAEQNMMSFAAGLAREGLVPLVHTFAVFMYRRALDQVEMSIAYGDMPVRMFGFLPGITTPGGPSHQATNDLAVMRSLPNMTVVEVGDATDVEGLHHLSRNIGGPLYIRMLRGELPRIFPADDPLILNRARVLSKGDDITLLTTGICTEEVMRVSRFLQDVGVNLTHLHVTTLKPFTDPQVLEAIGNAKSGVITMENHSSIGGLGSCVAELMAENGIGNRLIKVSTGDRYLQGANQGWLAQNYAITASDLVGAIESLLGRDLGFSEVQIAGVTGGDFVADNQLEAL